MTEAEERLKYLEELQMQKKYLENLPHLYGFKFYKWARRFFESRSKMLLLVAANQISKSSTQIRKAIHWSTDIELWDELWATPPRQFWYLYPTLNVATAEFETKWVPEFMPRGELKTHPKYGWSAKYKHGQISYIQWNSGVRLYFHAYSKNIHSMQSATCSAIFTDEELPEDHYGELSFRLAATDGYFSMVFTATKGQTLWYEAMERIGKSNEAFKTAEKIRATAYDCLTYEDGDESTPWTMKRIKELISKCSTDQEVEKRVNGRFVVDEGLLVPQYKPTRNRVKPYDIPKNWMWYAGVDVGSGGEKGHKGAIIFVAVKPDFTKGAICKGWKGNTEETTTAKDILDKFRIMRGMTKMTEQYYDWASKDFYTHAERLGECFQPADKNHERGRDTLNLLFKSQMLDLFDIPELDFVHAEFQLLSSSSVEGTNKKHADDDGYDSCRYTVTGIPWDYSAVSSMFSEPKEKDKPFTELDEIEERRNMMKSYEDEESERIEEDFSEFNELCGF